MVKTTAEAIAKDTGLTRKIVDRAWKKAQKNQGIFKNFREDFLTLLRLLKAWVRGEYKQIPWKSIIMAVSAALYFVNPFDLIPDFLVAGFVDDATVVAFVLQSIKKDLDKFAHWEIDH